MLPETQRLRDFIASVFLDEASILNNNDFLMRSCDYVVTVKYGALGWLGDEGATREILQRHRLQHRPRWSNLHKFKSNLCGPWPCQTREDSVVLKGREGGNRRSDMQKVLLSKMYGIMWRQRNWLNCYWEIILKIIF